MTAIYVNYAERKIVLSSAFVKRAFTPGTEEYRQLQAVRNDYPDFVLKTRQFKTNTKQERYRGLNYDFMRDYIRKHEPKETAQSVLDELEDQIGISKCHSVGKRYPTIKAWFLKRYPEIAEFGMDEKQLAKWREKQAAEAAKASEAAKADESGEESEAAENSNVTEMPSSDEAQEKADGDSVTVSEMPSASDEEKIPA